MSYNKLSALYYTLLFALAGATSAMAVDASHYTPTSVLSTGRWVKIRVSESGIHQITHEQLREWGFEDPAAVTVYGFGGVAGAAELLDESVPDDLPQQPVIYRDDRLLFYGESNYRPNLVYFAAKPSTIPVCPDYERNNVADAGYYFITDTKPTVEPAKIAYKPIMTSPFVRSHWSISGYEEELTCPVRQGQLYFGRDITQDSEALQYSFPIEDLYFESSTTTYTKVVFHDIVVGSGSNIAYTLTYPHRGDYINKSINLDSSNSHILISSNAASSDSYLSMSMPRESTSFDVSLSKYSGSKFTFAAIDRLVFAYPRHNIFGDRASLLLCDSSLSNGRIIEVSEAEPDLQVWNVDNAYDVRPYETIYNYADKTILFTNAKNYDTTVPGGIAHRAIAFDPSKEHLAVEYAGEVNNQDIHGYDVPDMVILSADAFVDQAERLAQIHRDLLHQDVVVLTQDKIFNEFSSGTPSLWGIRKAMKMFYDRNPAKMRHLLLFGGGFYDNRGFTATGAEFKNRGALLLNYGTPYHKTMSSLTTAYSCDGYFGMLGDTPPNSEFINNIQHINVGRIPVTDEQQAVKAVDKVHQYLTYTPTTDIYQRVLIITDHGDQNAHLLSGDSITASSFLSANPGITLIKGYSALYPLKGGVAIPAKSVIKQALKKGVMYVNYTGHGRPEFLGMSNLYHINDLSGTQYNYFPFAMLATCQAFTFDRLEQSIAQEMVMQNGGGMIGVVAACREVYQTRNEKLSETMAEIFANSPKGTTTGDILRKARNKMLSDTAIGDLDMMINASCYNLCGDPAIPLFLPSHDITIESINGEAYTEAEGSHHIAPLAESTISGYVNDPDNPGQAWDTFDGNVMLSIYESPITRTTVTLSNSSARQVNCDEDLLVEAIAPVKGGKFTLTFTPPMPARKESFNRATITAVLPDNSEIATTYTRAMACDVEAAPETPTDTEAPEITSLYIDSDDFVSGDVTSQDITVYATIVDTESGIYNPTGTVGPTCRITIDDTLNYPIVGTAMTNYNDGTVDIVYPFTALNDGRHTLTLHITDNAGNTATRTIDFVVNNSSANARLTVAETPARERATLELTHNFTETPTARIIIEDNAGNTVYSRDGVSFPYEWDLTDREGNLVADGVYRAYAACQGGKLYGHTPKVDIIVVQQP